MEKEPDLTRGLLIGATWLLWLLGGYAYLAANGSISMLSVIVDHYDKRNNERHYKLAVDALGWTAWSLFVFALVFGMIQDFQARF